MIDAWNMNCKNNNNKCKFLCGSAKWELRCKRDEEKKLLHDSLSKFLVQPLLDENSKENANVTLILIHQRQMQILAKKTMPGQTVTIQFLHYHSSMKQEMMMPRMNWWVEIRLLMISNLKLIVR